MSITARDLKLLWSKAAGRCSICRIILMHDSLHRSASYPVGEQAHIVAESDNGPRGQSILLPEERDSYRNLILLCPTHHREIDTNEADYPVEKLYLIKQAHEMWVFESLQNSKNDLKYPQPAPDRLADFIREWLDFDKFFSLYVLEIDAAIRFSEKRDLFSDEMMRKVKEWHRRRGVLRELLYLTGEETLVLQEVPAWERLRRQEQYLEEGNYKTPFSFILDFVNPVAMINLYGSAVWGAFGITREFIEILSWQYPTIKEMLTRGESV
jgi:hypothetical protein